MCPSATTPSWNWKRPCRKTVLLGEVHHRVKNNLQVISSLLNLQARTATPEANKALLDSQNHVRSMALIHQLLYERNDFSRIPMSVYVERLTHLLRDVSTGYGSHIAFVLERNGPEAFLELQNSIPFGLILNEIVVNACKHAFRPGQPGR
jgi:two-component sensor histidine kinase